ncbi:hypothetical protein BDV39DRAFT_213018 [Aspergillus sergii]|uniref:Uncharacterized protein n=1 Tax=Aspergillus sergii TaxID=1034303 RepID=A0A5N6WJ59_9EURO|nr:hypothetical protein BDV39DRAFT_213018 [Aspergillus sergii]
MAFLRFLKRERLHNRLVQARPHPFSRNYFKIEIDIPREEQRGKHKRLSVISVISACVKQLRDHTNSQQAPALPPEKKNGRVHFRVRGTTVDEAFDNLRQYLVEAQYHFQRSYRIHEGFVSMPLKCRRTKHSPPMFVMRWCEGGRNRRSIWPIVIEVPSLRDSLDMALDNGKIAKLRYLMIKETLYTTIFNPTYNTANSTPTTDIMSNMQSTHGPEPNTTRFYFRTPYNEANNTAKVISNSLRQLLADDTSKCLSIPGKKNGFWTVCYSLTTLEVSMGSKLRELEQYLQAMKAQLEVAPVHNWYTLPLKCQYRSNKVGSCWVEWYDAEPFVMARNASPKLLYLLDSKSNGARLDTSSRYLDDGLLYPPKPWRS